MEGVVASSDQPIVCRADNRRRLEQIDADVTVILKAMIRSEDDERNLSAKIVCAGVQMLAIQRDDPAAWAAFKNADAQAKEIACKGAGWPAREVATVLWRRYRASHPSRERISTYGKAIRIAHDSYWSQGQTEPEELLRHIVSARGVKGVLAIAKVAKGGSGRKKVVLNVPDVMTLYLVGPDGTNEPLPADITRRMLIEMGRLQ